MKNKHKKHLLKRFRTQNSEEKGEIETLDRRIRNECLNLIKKQEISGSYETVRFKDLPLSMYTLKALLENNITTATDVQTQFIPYGLIGGNILVQSPTGSGKTLAFLIPLLELLYRSFWENTFGVASIVLAPTRELASQIFTVLQMIGRFHCCTSTLLIGGHKDTYLESVKLPLMNIIIATPGRLLYHLDSTHLFNCSSLLLLVIDEADQMVDLGFFPTMKEIFNHLPSPESRQTWLFSATLKFAIRRLALITLNKPIQLIVRESNSTNATVEIQKREDSNFECSLGSSASITSDFKQQKPSKRLIEYFMRCPIEHQFSFIFSFLRAHSQSRLIVFVNTCKQVRFLYETFYRMKPGPALFHLHGRQNQNCRLEVFNKFSSKLNAACLICTDIAARGLDFPDIHWVIQLNCPLSVEMYIHRVGRTARYKSAGSSLLVLLPSEEYFLSLLKSHAIIPLPYELKKKVIDITGKLGSLLASNASLKHLAERALVSYFRSVCLAELKNIFKPDEVRQSIASGIESFGLTECPAELLRLVTSNIKKLEKPNKLQQLKQRILEKKKEKLNSSIGGTYGYSHKKDIKPVKNETSENIQTSVLELNLKNGFHQSAEVIKENDDSTEKKSNDQMDFISLSRVKALSKSEVNSITDKIDSLSYVNKCKLIERIRKQRIKIRSDGTAKIKGFSMLRPEVKKDHVFFDEDQSTTTGLIPYFTPNIDHKSNSYDLIQLSGTYNKRLHNLQTAFSKQNKASTKKQKLNTTVADSNRHLLEDNWKQSSITQSFFINTCSVDQKGVQNEKGLEFEPLELQIMKTMFTK